MLKKLLITLAVATLALSISTSKAEATFGYFIDSIYDNVNSNWLDDTPTLWAGETYDVTITGHAFTLFPDSRVSLGSSIDFYGTIVDISDWGTFTSDPIIVDGARNSVDFPGSILFAEYRISGMFTVPTDIETGTVQGHAWLHNKYRNGPENSSEAYNDLRRHKFDHKYTRAQEYFDVNLAAHDTTAVPEPASMALMTMGLAGAGLLRRKKK